MYIIYYTSNMYTYIYMCIVNPGPFHFKESLLPFKRHLFFTGRCYFLADLQNEQMSRSTLERKRAREALFVGRGRSWCAERHVELVQFVNTKLIYE